MEKIGYVIRYTLYVLNKNCSFLLRNGGIKDTVTTVAHGASTTVNFDAHSARLLARPTYARRRKTLSPCYPQPTLPRDSLVPLKLNQMLTLHYEEERGQKGDNFKHATSKKNKIKKSRIHSYNCFSINCELMNNNNNKNNSKSFFLPIIAKTVPHFIKKISQIFLTFIHQIIKFHAIISLIREMKPGFGFRGFVALGNYFIYLENLTSNLRFYFALYRYDNMMWSTT